MDKNLLDKLTPITEEEHRILKENSEINREIYMEGSIDIINSKKLLSQDKLITLRPHVRFVHFPEHSHDYVEVIYMCQGATCHIINGEKVHLKEGELLFLNQYAKQEIEPASKEDIGINFIILPEFFEHTLSMIGDEDTPLKRFVIDSLRNKESETSYLHFEVSDVLPVQNLVENLIYSLINDIPNKRKTNQITMGLLFLQLLNHTEKLSYKNKEEELILKVLRYIEGHYYNGSLSELAEKLHYDFAWLSREIKRKTDKTYTELVQEKRLSQAKYLLKNTDLNVDEIAAQTGYNNIAYFHKLFQKDTGTTPHKYRKVNVKNYSFE